MRVNVGQIEVVDHAMAAVFRKMTGAERLRVAFGLYSSARRMLLSHLRTEHPDWDEDAVIAEASRRLSHGVVESAQAHAGTHKDDVDD